MVCAIHWQESAMDWHVFPTLTPLPASLSIPCPIFYKHRNWGTESLIDLSNAPKSWQQPLHQWFSWSGLGNPEGSRDLRTWSESSKYIYILLLRTCLPFSHFLMSAQWNFPEVTWLMVSQQAAGRTPVSSAEICKTVEWCHSPPYFFFPLHFYWKIFFIRILSVNMQWIHCYF